MGDSGGGGRSNRMFQSKSLTRHPRHVAAVDLARIPEMGDLAKSNYGDNQLACGLRRARSRCFRSWM